MSERMKAYGVIPMHPEQKSPVEAHCFGDCGKVSMGGVVRDDAVGGIFLCFHAPCPHLSQEPGEMTAPYGSTTQHHDGGSTEYDIYLRWIA